MSSTGTLGYGLVGTGSIADFHAQALSRVEGARLRAVCSRDPEKAAAFAARYGVGAEPDLPALLARRDVDVVCVCTPSGVHSEAVLAALSAGKHVLCEKPLEISVKRIDRLLIAARRCRKLLGVIMPARFGPGARALKVAVEQGRFGRLTLCSAYVKWWRSSEYYSTSSWRGTRVIDGGGALMNQGIHAVDLLQWLAGPVARVQAFSANLAHPAIEVEDTLAATVRFRHGGLGVIECATSCSPGSARRIELCGMNGSAVLEDDRIMRWEFAVPTAQDREVLKGGIPISVGGATDPRAIGTEGHRCVFEDMTRAVLEKRAPAVSDGEGKAAVTVIEAIYRSAKIGRPVRIAAFRGPKSGPRNPGEK